MPTHKKLFEKQKIRRQLRRIYIFAVIVPVLVIGLYSVYSSRHQLQNDFLSLTRADSARLKSTLFDITTSMFTLSENIIQSYSYMHLLSSEDLSSEAAAYTQLTDYMDDCRRHNASISSICLYTNNQAITENEHITVTEDFSRASWYSDELEEKRQLWKTITEIDNFGNVTSYLTLVRKMGLPSPSARAYLVIMVSPNYMKNRLKNNEFQIICSVNDSPVFYSSDPVFAQKPMPLPEGQAVGDPHYIYSGITDFTGTKSLTSLSTFQPYRTEDTFYISVSNLQAMDRLRRVTAANLLMLLIAILFPSIIILVFSSRLSARIAVLRDAMHRASQGDYDIIENFSGDDELAETFHDLRETVQRVQETQKQYYEAEISREHLINEQQQMEFKMLASQINPHFLYNTLETIRMQALAAGTRDVAASVKLLGDSMHYVLENTGLDAATLEKELSYTKTYLRIQQLRFGDRIRYELSVDETVEPARMQILPLLIQPIVENAVIHGLAPKAEGGHILITVSRTPEQFLRIRVRDDGCGMTPEKLRQLTEAMNASTITGHSKSIGLANIHHRLCLLYGSAYTFHIDSSPSTGTDIEISFPADSANDKE